MSDPNAMMKSTTMKEDAMTKCSYCPNPATEMVSDTVGFCVECNPFCADCGNLDCDCTCYL